MATLKNKVVVITGASSGIGRACAIAFAKKGAKIVLAARRKDRLAALQQHIGKHRCIAVQTDVTKSSDIIRLFKKTKERFHRVDILLNNAGRGLKAYLLDIEHADWNNLIATNVTSVLLCTKEAVKLMLSRKTKGHIITISSMTGLVGIPQFGAYCASKHAVTGFKRSIQWELRKEGIKVSTLHPARVGTEFFKEYKKQPKRREMITSKEFSDYVVAVAERRLLRSMYFRFRNLLKRVFNLLSFQ